MNQQPFPEIIEQRLLAFHKRRWQQRLLRLICQILFFGLLLVLMLIMSDAWLRSPDILRMTAALCMWSAFLVILYQRLLRPLLHNRDYVAIAEAYEQQFPDALNQEISSAVSFSLNKQLQHESKWMQQRCIALATQHISSHHQPQRPHARLRLIGLILLLIWSGIFAQADMRSYLYRNLLPWLNIPRPTDILFSIEPGHLNIASGTEVTLKIRCTPTVPELICQVRWNDGHIEDIACKQDRKQTDWWYLDLGPALESYTYALRSGQAESARYQVQVGAAAEINDALITLRPPDYIQEQEQILKSGDTDVLRGSELHFVAQVRNFDLERADLRGEDDWALPLHIEASGDEFTISGTWPADSRQHYSLHLWNTDGLHHQHPQQWLIRVNDDAAPIVQLDLGLGHFPMCDQQATIPIHISAKDDFGIEKLTLIGGKGRQTLFSKEIATNLAKKQFDYIHTVQLQNWSPEIYDQMWVMAICRDNAGQEIQSPKHHWYISTTEHAQLARLTQQLQDCLSLIENIVADSHIFSNKWSDIRSNIRVDDIHSQSGDLLQVDQQLIGIQRRVNQLSRQWAAAIQASPASHREFLLHTQSLLSYVQHHHLPWLRSRGGVLLASKQSELNNLLEQSVTDSSLLVEFLDQLLNSAYASEARIGIDTLEQFVFTNQQCIAELKKRADGIAHWHEPTYTNSLRCHIYANTTLNGDAQIIDNRSVRIRNDSIPQLSNSNYSVHWQGEMYIPNSGEWTFQTESDDGIQLNLNGQELLSNAAWKTQAVSTFSNTLPLQQGWHPINIRYFQGGGEAVLNIKLGLKDAPSKDINEHQLRSPHLSSNNYHDINEMLVAELDTPIDDDKVWAEADTTVKNLVDATLMFHEWGARLNQLHFHNIAQAYAEAINGYTELVNKPESRKTWKHRSLSHYFHNARNICNTELRRYELPVQRSMRFDDLLIHLDYMLTLSKALKDWGLPYEQIAQTHRYLNRLQEHAIVLYQKCITKLEKHIANTALPYGIRMSAWHLKHQLRQQIYPKISKIEIDNHNIIWQLPDLIKDLNHLHSKQQAWRDILPIAYTAQLALIKDWQEEYGTWCSVRLIEQRSFNYVQQLYPLGNDMKTSLAQWQQLNTQASDNSIQLIENFIKHHKGNDRIPKTTLKHFWQHALLESEHLFNKQQRKEGLGALFIALSLQEIISQNAVDLKILGTICDTAKRIVREQSSALKQLHELVQTIDDVHLLRASRIDEQADIIADNPRSLFQALEGLESPQRFSNGTLDWQAWRNALLRASNTPIAINSEMHQFEQQHHILRDYIRQTLQQLLQSDKEQSLRWQALAKDLSELDRKHQHTGIMGMISSNIGLESQLQLLCLEQANYTFNRLRSFVQESQAAHQHLQRLLQSKHFAHHMNAQILHTFKQYTKEMLGHVHTALSKDLSTPQAQVEGKTWELLQKDIEYADKQLQSLQRLQYSLRVKSQKNVEKNAHQTIDKHLKIIASYWSKQSERQAQLAESSNLDALCLAALFLELETHYIEFCILSHSMLNPQHHDSRIWQSLVKIQQHMLNELSLRFTIHQQHLRDVLQNSSAYEVMNTEPLSLWQTASFQKLLHEVRQELRNHIESQEPVTETGKQKAQRLCNIAYAHAARLLQEQAQHVETQGPAEEHQQLFIQQRQTDDFNRRYEQQWQQAQTLIEMRAQFEDYSVYNSDQQLIIYDYFNAISSSEP